VFERERQVVMTLLRRRDAWWTLLSAIVFFGIVLAMPNTSPDWSDRPEPGADYHRWPPNAADASDRIAEIWVIAPEDDLTGEETTAALKASLDATGVQLGRVNVTPAIADALAGLPALRQLQLMSLAGANGQQLIDAGVLPRLTVLDLTAGELGPVAVRAIGQLQGVRTLLIRYADQPAVELMEAVAELPMLETLYLPEMLRNGAWRETLAPLADAKRPRRIAAKTPFFLEDGYLDANQIAIALPHADVQVDHTPRTIGFEFYHLLIATYILGYVGLHAAAQFSINPSVLTPGWSGPHRRATAGLLGLTSLGATTAYLAAGVAFAPALATVLLVLGLTFAGCPRRGRRHPSFAVFVSLVAWAVFMALSLGPLSRPFDMWLGGAAPGVTLVVALIAAAAFAVGDRRLSTLARERNARRLPPQFTQRDPVATQGATDHGGAGGRSLHIFRPDPWSWRFGLTALALGALVFTLSHFASLTTLRDGLRLFAFPVALGVFFVALCRSVGRRRDAFAWLRQTLVRPPDRRTQMSRFLTATAREGFGLLPAIAASAILIATSDHVGVIGVVAVVGVLVGTTVAVAGFSVLLMPLRSAWALVPGGAAAWLGVMVLVIDGLGPGRGSESTGHHGLCFAVAVVLLLAGLVAAAIGGRRFETLEFGRRAV